MLLTKRYDYGSLWHALIGSLIARFATLWLVNAWWAVLGLAAFGVAREAYTHRDDRPMFSRHRVIEALAWPLGGAVALLF